jgi:hypothetical protein
VLLDVILDTVPNPAGCRGSILQRFWATVQVAIIPTIKDLPRNTHPVQRLFGGEMRLLNQPDNLELQIRNAFLERACFLA